MKGGLKKKGIQFERLEVYDRLDVFMRPIILNEKVATSVSASTMSVNTLDSDSLMASGEMINLTLMKFVFHNNKSLKSRVREALFIFFFFLILQMK